MSKIRGWAALGPKQKLAPFEYDPGPLGPEEVEIAVEHCGLCHSDLSFIEDDSGFAKFPFIPGHEAIGRVVALGEQAKRLKVGQTVGLGGTAQSCMHCRRCLGGDQRLCLEARPTIIGRHGAFADRVRAHWAWVIPLPESLERASAGPLLCGGVTVFFAVDDLRRQSLGPRRDRRHRRTGAPRLEVRPRLGLRSHRLYFQRIENRRGEGLRRRPCDLEPRRPGDRRGGELVRLVAGGVECFAQLAGDAKNAQTERAHARHRSRPRADGYSGGEPDLRSKERFRFAHGQPGHDRHDARLCRTAQNRPAT